jgi:hypothetical protein
LKRRGISKQNAAVTLQTNRALSIVYQSDKTAPGA